MKKLFLYILILLSVCHTSYARKSKQGNGSTGTDTLMLYSCMVVLDTNTNKLTPYLVFQEGDTIIGCIDSNGTMSLPKILVNTKTTSSYALDVNGDARISGIAMVENNDEGVLVSNTGNNIIMYDAETPTHPNMAVISSTNTVTNSSVLDYGSGEDNYLFGCLKYDPVDWKETVSIGLIGGRAHRHRVFSLGEVDPVLIPDVQYRNSTIIGWANRYAIGGDIRESFLYSNCTFGNNIYHDTTDIIGSFIYITDTVSGVNLKLDSIYSGVFMMGGYQRPINNVWFGNAGIGNTFNDLTYHGNEIACGKGYTSKEGGTIVIAGGRGIGPGTGGDVVFSTSDSTTTSAQQDLTARWRVKWHSGTFSNVDTPPDNLTTYVESTTQFAHPNPNMTSTQRDAISSPAAGDKVYCTDCTADDASTGVEQTYNGTTWKNHW